MCGAMQNQGPKGPDLDDPGTFFPGGYMPEKSRDMSADVTKRPRREAADVDPPPKDANDAPKEANDDKGSPQSSRWPQLPLLDELDELDELD